MADAGREAVLLTGDLGGVIACASCANQPPESPERRPLAIVAVPNDEFKIARSEAAAAQAETFDLERIDLAPSAASTPQDRTLVLLRACYEAVARGATSLTWPDQLESPEPGAWPDLDELALCVDRALLVGRLVSLDSPPHGIQEFRVETPYIDLTDRQLAELAMDLAVPVELCWWWREGASGSGEAGRLYRRWTRVLREVGWASTVA
ncbi:MAG: hypothetical protein H6811_10925 [Phycisphaeraceae bacterium]|nr:hypothetical protein [Phycisphaeraceae bacterium]